MEWGLMCWRKTGEWPIFFLFFFCPFSFLARAARRDGLADGQGVSRGHVLYTIRGDGYDWGSSQIRGLTSWSHVLFRLHLSVCPSFNLILPCLTVPDMTLHYIVDRCPASLAMPA
ncbi:hypothetical protein F5Y00DRAFT_223207, partial [Daldinia vernicosa]|uniref:uncharacterized protein n=1 Tax=Daldinia vernicosa TaxID=114800 RepID=UPI0020079BEF